MKRNLLVFGAVVLVKIRHTAGLKGVGAASKNAAVFAFCRNGFFG